MLEKVKVKWNKFMYGTECRKKKVTVRDLQKNVLRIQEALIKTQNRIDEIANQMVVMDLTSEESRSEYARLEQELTKQHALYGVLQGEMDQEYVTIKKMKESRFAIPPKDGIIIGGLIFVGTFMIALERENPKALKLASFLLKLFPLHI